MAGSREPAELSDPLRAASTGGAAAMGPFVDPQKFGEIAPGFHLPAALPFSLPGAEGAVQPTSPPAAGADPRGAPPQAWAVLAGSVPGGTGAPGYYFLPFPGAASPVMPGEGQGGKLPGAPAPGTTPDAGGASQPPGATVPPGVPQPPGAPSMPSAPPMPTAGDVPDAAQIAPGMAAPAPPTMAPGTPSGTAVPPAGSAVPAGASSAFALPDTEGLELPGLGAPLPAGPVPPTAPTMPAASGPEGGASVARGVSPAAPAVPDAPSFPHDVPDDVAVPTAGPEDEAALRLATELFQQLAGGSAHLEHEPVQQANRQGLMPHLPTSDAQIRDLLGLATGPAMPAAAAPPDGEKPASSWTVLDNASAPPAPEHPAEGGFDVNVVRKDFPILHQEVHGKQLVWFDNAATTQKPRAVIDAVSRYYERDNSNIHRGAHTLAARATDAYEGARDIVRRFLGASTPEEIIFARGTTEAINLVAKSWGRKHIQAGDEIVLTQLEHHANIVPWQMLAKETGAVLKVVPITNRGEIILEEYARLLNPRTKLVAVTQVSNALGTVNPVAEMAGAAHRHGVPILVDGAQSVPHIRANVQEIGADFFVFSGHKIFAPTGIGALYVNKEHLEDMPPWQGGGSMIRDVTFEKTTYADPPAKFEAGTPSIGDAVGLGAALEYVERLGIENLERYEHELLEYMTERLREVRGLRLIGTARHKVSVQSFLLEGTRPEDVGRYLDSEGIAVRAGHHCAQPTMQHYGVQGTVRPSLALYNTREEVDRLIDALKRYRYTG